MDSQPNQTATDFRLLLLAASPAQDPSIRHAVAWWNALAPLVGAATCDVVDLSSRRTGIDGSMEGAGLRVLLTDPDELDVRVLIGLRSTVETGACLLLSGPVAFPLVQAWLGPSAPPYRFVRAPVSAAPSLYLASSPRSPREFPDAKWHVDTGCFVWRTEPSGFLVRAEVEAPPGWMHPEGGRAAVAFGARRLGAGMLAHVAAPAYLLARTEASRTALAEAVRAALDAWRGRGETRDVTPEAKGDSIELDRTREPDGGDSATQQPGTTSKQETREVPGEGVANRGDGGAREPNRVPSPSSIPDSSWSGPWNRTSGGGTIQAGPLTSPWFRLVARGMDGAQWTLRGSQVLGLSRDVAQTCFGLLADDKGNSFARYISTVHPLAEFSYIEGRWHIRVPEESPNGVLVDGVRVGPDWYPLVEGARIQPFSTRQNRSIAALELVAEAGDT